MNKSTPLNLLPSQTQQQQQQQQQSPTQGQGQFINKQHRDLITQAHNAAQNFTVPVNTQLGGEYARDDDTTIQETLRLLSSSEQAVPKIQQLPPIQHQPQQQQQQLQLPVNTPPQGNGQQQGLHMFNAPQDNRPVQSSYGQQPPSHLQGLAMDTFTASTMAPDFGAGFGKRGDAGGMFWFLGDLEDLKLAGLVAVLSLVLALMPVGQAVQAYMPLALRSLPYSDLVTKAIMTGLIFYVVRGFLL